MTVEELLAKILEVVEKIEEAQRDTMMARGPKPKGGGPPGPP